MANDFFSIAELENTKFDVMDFKGKWQESFGLPEKRGVWIVYGESSNGKTTFLTQLAKYLTNFIKHKVLYNTLEEGKSLSFLHSVKRAQLSTVSDKILLGNRVPMETIYERLRKQRSPEVIIIDSLQYTELNKRKYVNLKKEFNHKLWIFNSHAKFGEPKGSLADDIKYDADIKVFVKGFKAFVETRFEGGEPYIIDAKRAAKYHGEIE